jgi:transcriptional regulator with XRE-family HTH domain
MTINERLFELMEQKNIKYTTLANKLNINKTVVSNWKGRGNNPPIEYTVPICELLGISIEYFITGTETISHNLSEEESEILKLYKSCDSTGKTAVKGLLKTLSKPEESEGKLSDSRIG